MLCLNFLTYIKLNIKLKFSFIRLLILMSEYFIIIVLYIIKLQNRKKVYVLITIIIIKNVDQKKIYIYILPNNQYISKVWIVLL